MASLLGAILSETAARLYLGLLWDPAASVGAQGLLPKEIAIFDRLRWQYDERYGYRHRPNLELHEILPRNGTVFSCRLFLKTNQFGRPGNYETMDNPDIKIAVVGDSWTSFYVDGKTYTDYLAEDLTALTGRKVELINYGQGGMGILQMLDMAADVAETTRPDFLLINFITDDLDRARHWQIAATIDSEPRELVSLQPTPSPDLASMVDASVVEPAAAMDWCRDQMGKRDAVVERSEAKYRRYVANATPVLDKSALWRLRHSFLYERIATGRWFGGFPPLNKPASLPRFSERDFSQLPGFTDDVHRLHASGAPTHFFHLATAAELTAKTIDVSLDPQRRALWTSLERETGAAVLGTLEPMIKSGVQPELMTFSDTNAHPSRYGMQSYAAAIAAPIAQYKLLPSRPAGSH